MIKNQNSKVVQREDIMGGRCKKGLKEEIILKSAEIGRKIIFHTRPK